MRISTGTVPALVQDIYAATMSFYSKAKLTVVTTALLGGVGVTLLHTVPGVEDVIAASEARVVPGPEVGAGLPFLVVACVLAAYAMLRHRRSTAG